MVGDAAATWANAPTWSMAKLSYLDGRRSTGLAVPLSTVSAASDAGQSLWSRRLGLGGERTAALWRVMITRTFDRGNLPGSLLI